MFTVENQPGKLIYAEISSWLIRIISGAYTPCGSSKWNYRRMNTTQLYRSLGHLGLTPSIVLKFNFQFYSSFLLSNLGEQ